MAENILEINNLSKYFGGLAAVSDCSLNVKRGIKRYAAQKYITSLFVALSEDSAANSKKSLKYLVKDSQTPKGLNEQAVKQLRKAGFYRDLEKSLNSILKRLNRV